MIPVGRMRERIQITQHAVRTDSMGNHTVVQVPYCSRWAYVNKTSGSETEEAGSIRSEESIYFIVRFDEMTRAITPTVASSSAASSEVGTDMFQIASDSGHSSMQA